MRTPHPAFRQPHSARFLPLAASIALALAPSAYGAIPGLVVNTTAAFGDGTTTNSLNDAINFANANCVTVPSPVITFNLGAGPFVIAPSTLLGFFCGSAAYNPTIDGYSQAGSSQNGSATGFTATVKVVIDGSNFAYGGCGLHLDSSAYGGTLTILGTKIENFNYGTFDAGACGNLNMQGNVVFNNSYGAQVQNGTIGGPLPADRNVFIGNHSAGIEAMCCGGTITIENNFVGTLNGTSSTLANKNATGILLSDPISSTVVGNTISGNDIGIHVFGDYGGSSINGNNIGTDSTGLAALPNIAEGIFVEYSRGSPTIGTGNTIAHNGAAGISIRNSSSITVDTNQIFDNSGAGVAMDNTSSISVIGNTIGTAGAHNTRGVDGFCSNSLTIEDNTIGPNQNEGLFLNGVNNSSLERNTISGNGGTGLRIDNTICYGAFNLVNDNTIASNGINGVLVVNNSVGNTISANSIYGNTRRSINLNNSTSTLALPNDAGDLDTGANNQQNWPDVTAVVQSAFSTQVDYALDTQDGTYTLDFFANPAMANPAGRDYITSTSIVVYGGPVTGTFFLSGTFDNISMTATSVPVGAPFLGDTSEYSPMKAAITAPAATVTPFQLNFGTIVVNTQSAPKTSTVRSVGDQPYIINFIDYLIGPFSSTTNFCYGLDAPVSKMSALPASSVCYGGGFICETTCQTSTDEVEYAKNDTCSITARFAPTFPGFYQAGVCLFDNTGASPHSVLLQGTAVPPPPITLSPSTWDFGDVPLGLSSDPRSFTITSQVKSTVNLGQIATTGEFDVLDTDCGTTLPGEGSCHASVAFLPTESGDLTGTLVVPFNQFLGDTVNASAFPITFETVKSILHGNGLQGGTLVLPDAIEVGAAVAGGAPISRTIQLVNSGTAPVTVTEISIAGPFTVINGCTEPIAPGASCNVTIGFTALSAGSFNGTLTVVSNATGGSGEIPVHATGQTFAAPLLVIVPHSIGFGDRVIGSSTDAQQVSITNLGGVTATLGLSSATIDFLIASTSCAPTLEPQASCFAQVAFRPLGFGLRLGSLVVTSNAPNSPQSVVLVGTGCRPFVASGNRVGDDSNCAP